MLDSRLILVCGLALGPAVSSCSDAEPSTGGEVVAAEGPSVTQVYPEASVPQIPLGSDAPVLELAAVLEDGYRTPGGREAAARLMLALDPELGLDYHLLRARWLAYEGELVESSREIEAARQAYPDQGRVYATAAEIHALGGRLETANNELKRGFETVGRTPELERASGLAALCSSRSVPQGWKVLTRLAALHPELPFLRAPLADAQLLMGRRALNGGDALLATACAQDGLEARPGDRELRELLAEAAVSRGEFAQATEIYEEFLLEGEDCAEHLAILHQRASTASLVLERRDRALAHAERARELGLSNEELGFSRTLLREEQVNRGLAAYGDLDYSLAAQHFERALELDPDFLEAHDHRGAALFRVGRYSEAALHFEASLAGLWERGSALPTPVHLNLARALVLAERGDEVQAILERYLEREPQGPYADETREMIARLEVTD